jgi:hypothetical protein
MEVALTDLMAWVIVGYTLGGVCAVLEAARWLWMEKCGGRRRAKARQDRYEEAFIENLPAFFEARREKARRKADRIKARRQHEADQRAAAQRIKSYVAGLIR